MAHKFRLCHKAATQSPLPWLRGQEDWLLLSISLTVNFVNLEVFEPSLTLCSVWLCEPWSLWTKSDSLLRATLWTLKSLNQVWLSAPYGAHGYWVSKQLVFKWFNIRVTIFPKIFFPFWNRKSPKSFLFYLQKKKFRTKVWLLKANLRPTIAIMN